MADDLDISEVFERVVQANVKLYQGWLDLSIEYVRGLSDVFAVSGTSTGAADSAVEAEETGVLMMEGEEGTEAQSTFLITNDLSRKVSCQLVASRFTDSDGNAVRPKVTFGPKTFELKPGEQRVVHAAIDIDRKLTAGYGYQGEFAIKGMEGLSVPVVLRRRHGSVGVPENPIERARTDSEPAVDRSTARKAPPKKTTATKKRAPRKG